MTVSPPAVSYAREGVFLYPTTVEHLAREINALEVESSRLAQRLASAYERYLDLLRRALPQQLVQACYVLCTQVHPQEFLRLSYEERCQLQQRLKRLGETTSATLTLDRLMQQAQHLKDESDLAAAAVSEPFAKPSSAQDVLSTPSGQTEVATTSQQDREQERDLRPWVESSPPVTASDPAQRILPDRPGAIARWLQQIGEMIRWQLRQASIAANQTLQQAQLFTAPLPQELLVASLTEDAPQAPSGPPNLLRLIVTHDAEETSEEGQLVAVALRLPEIEFADPHLMDQRRELQGLAQELRRLGQRYAERQRQWAIAQAESAWRTSWPRD